MKKMADAMFAWAGFIFGGHRMMIVAISPLHVCCTSFGKVSAVGMMAGAIAIAFGIDHISCQEFRCNYANHSVVVPKSTE